MRYKPPSITDIGLNVYLDRRKEKHGGFGYYEFVKMVENEVNTANIARAFKVSRLTIAKWLKIYQKERTKNDNKKPR